MAVIETAEKILPSGLRAVLSPVLRRHAGFLQGENEVAAAQRMALIAFAIRIISAGIAFVSQIALARLMGEFEYGIFVFVWVLVVLFGNLSCLGFHSTVIRFLPQYRAANAHDEIRGLTVTARIFSMLSASMLATIGFVGLHLFGEGIASYYLVPVFLGLFCLPMIALGDVLDGTARANSWPVVALSPTYIVRPLLILSFMLAAVYCGAPKTATTAMQAGLAATYATSIGQFVAVTWRLRRNLVAGPRRIDFLVWFNVALPIFLIEGFGFLLTNSDVVVVGLYLDPQEVAVYFAAAKTITLVQFVYFSVKAAAAPQFSAMMAEGDMQALARFAGETVRWSFWPSLVVGLSVLAAGDLLLSLFGPAFGAGYVLMAILFAGILAKSLVGPGEVLLTMAGRQKLCVLLYAGALAANIGLNVTLIPLFGLVGAASATAAAMMVEALLLHLAVRRTLGIVLFAFAHPLILESSKKT
ncbi:lipopolysaccharide biosynthesis protein [Rhizobiaceae bacterium n13]|uniref:Lipopolysaccharide biosynthesis protein n=1 Tax=Ferirhizobium litorale TaxID=2927786 RepID=A0AAE3U492_9HYPH|nr:lipopolysaccharide biosynthesis protein [Fererhizobium litorale]MDI7864268.1 lipopolysaccharide biosynthesis protein [Fererhizobium litorale]MDI7924627.1 lipopolysaccharide biosynthesis protein [Fererhizobium litorale]